MSDLQERISAWAATTFPNSTPRAVREHWREEAQELDNVLGVFVRYGTVDDAWVWDAKHPLDIEQAPDGPKETGGRPLAQAIEEEAADVMHLLFQVATLCEFDLLDATERKFAVNQARTWGEPDANGVVRHVEEQS